MRPQQPDQLTFQSVRQFGLVDDDHINPYKTEISKTIGNYVDSIYPHDMLDKVFQQQGIQGPSSRRIVHFLKKDMLDKLQIGYQNSSVHVTEDDVMAVKQYIQNVQPIVANANKFLFKKITEATTSFDKISQLVKLTNDMLDAPTPHEFWKGLENLENNGVHFDVQETRLFFNFYTQKQRIKAQSPKVQNIFEKMGKVEEKLKMTRQEVHKQVSNSLGIKANNLSGS